MTGPALFGAVPPPAIALRGIRRSFADREVLSDIDLDVAPGEFVALLGQSGTGKSTLLRILAGLDADVQGTVGVSERRAVVFQEPRLYPWKRVWRNVWLGLERDARRTTPASRRLVDRALDEVGLAERADAWPVTLSGGEAQRVALARALVREPQLLLLDEPFGALDALTRLRMQALVARLWRRHGPAVVLVTHDVDEAIVLAERILVLSAGRVVTDVRVDIAHPRHRSGAGFERLRSRLLADLGVEEPEA